MSHSLLVRLRLEGCLGGEKTIHAVRAKTNSFTKGSSRVVATPFFASIATCLSLSVTRGAKPRAECQSVFVLRKQTKPGSTVAECLSLSSQYSIRVFCTEYLLASRIVARTASTGRRRRRAAAMPNSAAADALSNERANTRRATCQLVAAQAVGDRIHTSYVPTCPLCEMNDVMLLRIVRHSPSQANL